MVPLIGVKNFLSNSPLLAVHFLIPITQGLPDFTPGSFPPMIELDGFFS